MEPPSLDRRALLRRMAAGGAVVWASPMLHSVASAQAAPSCGAGLLDWDDFTTGSTFTNTIIGNTTISLTISNVTNTTVTGENAEIMNVNAGNTPGKSLRFAMNANNGSNGNGSRQTITFTFSNPVTNVAFTLMDIDNFEDDDGWGDRVVMLTPGYTFVPAVLVGATRIIGSGTNADRFRNLNPDNNLDNTSNAGNVRITYPGPISSFSFIYRNQVNTGAPQRIDMGDITFTC